MSGFIHKAEDALHLHHKDKGEHKHDNAHEHPPTIGHDGLLRLSQLIYLASKKILVTNIIGIGHEHTHRSHPPQNKHTHHHPNEDQIARDDFKADREYDRALKSPHHGPGLGFEA
ncbi:hypothetical protein BDQ94DRAFT_140200 [Aspergillus welwitschiae]|uniref:Uncharacterized protein n=1 Tax=Aspergillus welwitschiae TaxID=1341132 RepID=A0A3F3Q796_9EURO|nr:hypothetical protein BDQ94DRAFT_140200 [Aspergillus welwitschiae]RDH35094.1 hypothetical protein BDQ94DRAFT_140200 [Aspergillus welwitschiae]